MFWGQYAQIQMNRNAAKKTTFIEAVCEFKHADVTGGEWRLKYERAIREIEFTKKRLQQEFDDKLEVEQQNKRQLERRVSEHKHLFPTFLQLPL